MAIQRIVIDNYRSIQHLELELGPVSALIGPNNAGKSNILRALDLVVGETWPSRPFARKDFHGYRADDPIEITVYFQNALRADGDVHGFRLRYTTDEEVEYFAVDADGDPCTYGRGQVKRVSNAMRDEVASLHVGLDRQAEKQLRVNPWTLYGKLLRRIESTLGNGARDQFGADVRAAIDAHLRNALDPAQQIIDDFVRRQTGLQVELDFRLVDPLEVLKGVRPYIVSNGIHFEPDDCGAGVQSALAVAIAKAYAEIVREPLVLALEEPELYLHPHGCRHFYRLLQELAGQGLQIVYATHERAFVNPGDFEEINLVRMSNGSTTVRAGRSIALDGPRDRLRLQSRFNDKLSEVFFANWVVLVEGEPDEIAVRSGLEAQGVELDRSSVSVVSVGGQAEVCVVGELLRGFRIPVIAVVDEDPGNPNSAATRGRIRQKLGAQNLFLQRPNLEGLFELGQKPSRVEAMDTFPRMFRDANRIPQVYRDVAVRIRRLA